MVETTELRANRGACQQYCAPGKCCRSSLFFVLRLPVIERFGVKSKEQVVSENFEAFEEQLPQLLQTHAGKYALLRDKRVVEFFDSIGDAVKYGRDNFADGLYSV